MLEMDNKTGETDCLWLFCGDKTTILWRQDYPYKIDAKLQLVYFDVSDIDANSKLVLKLHRLPGYFF